MSEDDLAAGCGVAGAAADGVTSFLLMTLRFAVVFLAFLEDFSPFFFAICLLDDAAAYMPSKCAPNEKGEGEAAHGKGIKLSVYAIVCVRHASHHAI
jgi:hypothetical protein